MKKLIWLLLILAPQSFGESATLSTTGKAPSVSSGKWMAYVDLRPCWTTATKEFHTENYLEGGYAFSRTTSLSFGYDFNTNLDDPTRTPGSVGLKPTTIDGFVRSRLGRITELPGGFVLAYENRAYLPMEAITRSHGHVATIRNYFDFTKTFSKRAKLTLTELPIVHFYDRPGFQSGKNVRANPLFENRIYAKPEIFLTDYLSLSVPIMFHILRARDFAGAENDSATTVHLWLHPELTYAYDDNISFGIAYYSDNLLTPTLSDTAFDTGFSAGVVQFSMSIYL